MEIHELSPAAGPAPRIDHVLPAGGNGLATEYLAFSLGEQAYATPILAVQEIRNFEKPTRMVQAAPYVLGVLNLRGTVVPVLDLRVRLGLQARFDHRTATVLLNLLCGTVGVVVDGVSDVLALHGSQMQPMPMMLNDSPDRCLFQGLVCASHGDTRRDLIVIDFEGLLPTASPLHHALNA